MSERIGRYLVEEVVGTGAFATVYRARDERLDGHVALKVLAENHAFDPDLRERFILEGRLLRRVSSPNVITVHDLGETDRAQPYLVLDLARGGDLRRRVREARAAGWSPTAADVRDVAVAVAEAMRSLHAAEVVHRDLSPGNLLLVGADDVDLTVDRGPSEEAGPGPVGPAHRRPARLIGVDERLVVADLGLSKDLAVASGLTVGTGTTGFTPPEQRTAGSWIDTRADIWSASALLVWLLTGAGPADEGDWRAALRADRWSEPLIAALGAGLADDPTDRPAGAADWCRSVLEALGPPAGDAGAGVVGSSGPDHRRAPVGSADGRQGESVRSPARTGEVSRRTRAVAALALVAALVVGVVAGVSIGRRGTSSDRVSERTTLADGQVRFTTTEGDSSLELTGPAEVTVGEAAIITAAGDRLVDTTWMNPDGQVFEDEDRVQVTPSSTGSVTVIAVGRDEDGRQLVAEFRFRATG